ncbi:MAG: hypothetical protein HOG66_06670 [Flavobacteriales bacterium]|nr:hypothetical protein [Flavobacteriales bacterium]MBT6917858.1 hypothetical protein [Flavobacteriales bacterium]
MNKSWLFFLLMLCTSLRAQDPRTDSLQDLIQRGDTNSIIAIDWVHMSRHHLINSNYPKAIRFAHKAIELSIGDTNIECKARFYLANSLQNSQPRKALEAVLENEVIMEEYDHPWQYFNLRLASALYRDFGEFPEAVANQQKVVDLVESGNDSFFLMESYTDMGFLYDRMHEYETCLEWQFKAKTLAELMKDTSYAFFINGRIGIAYDELEQFDSAHFYNELSLAVQNLKMTQNMSPRTFRILEIPMANKEGGMKLL